MTSIFISLWIFIFKLHIVESTSSLSEVDLSKLDNLIEAAIRCRHFPGVSLAVVTKDRILLQKGYGYADLENGVLVTEDTLFPIASTTKAFTSTILAMLLEESSFNWDTPIKDIDPKFELHNDLLTNHVTLRDILTHMTGIPGYYVALMAGYPDSTTMEDLVRSFSYHQPTEELRTDFMYNNFMYALAGYIAEVLSGGERWEDLVNTRIFQPLNMNASTFVTQMNKTGVRENVAKSYVHIDSQTVAIDMSTIGQVIPASPAGSIISSARDMSQWLQFHLRLGKSPSNEVLLSTKALKALYDTPVGGYSSRGVRLSRPNFPVSDVTTKYALAWVENVYRGYTRIWHSGGILTYKTQLWLLPGIEAGIFLVTNGPQTRGSSFAMGNIAQYITDLLTGEEPWLNTTTMCTFPHPWKNERPQSNNASYIIDDHVHSPYDRYIGSYSHPAFGEIRIIRNIILGRHLRMEMGKYIEADLYYNKEKDVFVTKLLNKYWYMDDRIPLEFMSLDYDGDGVKTYTSIHMPLYTPYDTAIKMEFTKQRFGNSVYNCGASNRISSYVFCYFIWLALIIANQ